LRRMLGCGACLLYMLFFPKGTKDSTTGRISRAPAFTAFLKEWNQLVNSITYTDFAYNLTSFQKDKKHPISAVNYSLNT
jgi:hypothetical protein